MNSTLYTIGHSNHEIGCFLELLRRHEITAVFDVRSQPYSRYAPQFSRESLHDSLARAGIDYLFLGKELGGRSDNPACYKQGKIQYELLAQEPCFNDAIQRVIQGMSRQRIALMCSEKDPAACHRALLVARKLVALNTPVCHILADGGLESHHDLESRLLAICNLPQGDLFTSREEYVADAYSIQSERVGYQDPSLTEEGSAVES